MSHLAFSIECIPKNQQSCEIVIAFLTDSGFNSFQEHPDGNITAIITRQELDWPLFRETIGSLKTLGIDISYAFSEIDDQNWNEEWEKSFKPVYIDDKVLIRAPFHSDANDLLYTIIIEPKMSFGTGHHYTTRLMIEAMMQINLAGKLVLDMGCGTAILGILASKMQAEKVIGVDIDSWAFENAKENVKRNKVHNMELRLGDVSALSSEAFDVILANINRNVLIRDIPQYVQHLKPGGDMILSGFLTEDVQYVLDCAYANTLSHLHSKEDAGWLSLSFKKIP